MPTVWNTLHSPCTTDSLLQVEALFDPGSSFADAAAFIRQQETGRDAYIETPFGRRLSYYADLTATGRHLDFVEAWIDRVRPFYANTHTAVSSTGRLLTKLREQSRQVVRRAVNAGPEDEILFCGSGATASINKLIGLLGIRIAEPLDLAYQFSRQIPTADRPVVFLGPYEHHSNQLPWVETVADVVEIDLDTRGGIDLGDLDRRLAEYADRPLKVGSFSAASNVSGIVSDVHRIAKLLHRYGAYAVFDYAAAGPYVPIDMHPSTPSARIDALFISPHKFVGGPEASGVLVAHRSLFRTRTPERPGGGTVDYVAAADRESIDYVRRLDEREEGGTPAILGDLRVGASFLVKQMIDPTKIFKHETELAKAAVDRLSAHPRIQIMGPLDLPRLSIISFNIDELHYDLVSALLDHLFGIQNRAGCSCAGPYGHRLIGIDRPTSERYRELIKRGINALKPGWVRITLPYYASQEDVDFVLSAVEFIADYGLQFVPLYRLEWDTGAWRHTEESQAETPPLELTVETLREAVSRPLDAENNAPISDRHTLLERRSYFQAARECADRLCERWKQEPPSWNPPTGSSDVDEIVWFRYVNAGDLDSR